MSEVVETRTGRCWLRGDGILQWEGIPDATHSLKDAAENVAALARVARGQHCPSLICLRSILAIDRDARQYYAGPEAANASTAIGMVGEFPVARVIGTFFLGLNKPSMPVQLFSSETEALDWLRTFLR